MPDHPEAAPAPWINTGEAYRFFLPTSATLPEGAYAPLENESFYASPEAGIFRGGWGSAQVQVVRYTDTPAGPYDELIYIPGKFDSPSGKAHLRITRIYVSTDESIYNGRKNWNIPKHLARFIFTPLKPGAANSPIKIQVFPPSPADAHPFFSAIATPSAWIPTFPFNTKYLPTPMGLQMVHPPLPALEPNAYSLVGTEQWNSILPSMRGKTEIVWFTPGGDEGLEVGEYADGVGFPKIQPRALGMHLRHMTLDFPMGHTLNMDGKKRE